jgi:hypothetical protein
MSKWPLLLVTTDANDFIVVDIVKQKIMYKSGPTKVLDCPYYSDVLSIEREIKNTRKTYRPFGLTYDKDFIYVCSHDKIGKFNRRTYKFISLVEEIKPLYVNTHQILKCKYTGTFYTCNTSNDTIGIHKGSDKKFINVNNFSFCTPVVTKEVNELDECHLNTIYQKDATNFIICNNNCKKGIQSDFWEWNTETNRFNKLVSAGTSSHNVVIKDDFFYTLSSGAGRLIEINFKTQEKVRYDIGITKKWVRGMDTHNNILIIGNSVHRAERENTSEIAEIVLFSLKTKKQKSFELPGVYTIHDIKLLK